MSLCYNTFVPSLILKSVKLFEKNWKSSFNNDILGPALSHLLSRGFERFPDATHDEDFHEAIQNELGGENCCLSAYRDSMGCCLVSNPFSPFHRLR